jgi:hypothetical protein
VSASKNDGFGSTDSANYDGGIVLGGCEKMAEWFLECSESEIQGEDVVDSCVNEVEEIMETCNETAANAYLNGIEATYACYLNANFCATPEDLEAYPDVLETCGSLYDEHVESFEECFDSGIHGNPLEVTTAEPEMIDYTPPFTLANQLDLTDDEYVHLQLPFPLKFFTETTSILTITSNGVVFVGEQNNDGCCFGLALPDYDQHNGLIALGWTDLIPSSQNNISWDVIGEAPNRELWIRYDYVPTYGGSDTHVASRLRYVEGGKSYDILLDSIVSNEPTTVGLESIDGNLAIVNENHNELLINLERKAFRYQTDAFE